jgi:hypothetical protein
MPTGITITSQEAIVFCWLDSNHCVEIATLEIRAKSERLVADVRTQYPLLLISPDKFNSVAEDLHVQLVLVPLFPLVVVLLIHFYAICQSRTQVH